MNFRTRGPIFYLLQAPNGRVVVGNLPGMPPVNGVVDFVPKPDTPAPEADGERTKLTGFGLTLPDGSFLLVAQDAARLADMQHAIVRAFAWAGGLTLLLAIAGGAVLANSFLRRIDAITRTNRAIMEGDLSARIPVRGTHDEIDQLIASLNAMLGRIQQLMDGLRQVSSDIAHDLRTPLGRLRQHLEDARERAKTTADYDAATEAAIAEADELWKPSRPCCASPRSRPARRRAPSPSSISRRWPAASAKPTSPPPRIPATSSTSASTTACV